MNSNFRFDDRYLAEHIQKACNELGASGGFEGGSHSFSEAMHQRMQGTFRQERRYRLWQKAKMLLAVILTLLVAAAMIYTYCNYDRIVTAVEDFLRSDSEPPFGAPPDVQFSDEIAEDYRVLYHFRVNYAGYDNKYSGTVILRHRINGREIKIEYVPTRLTETYDPDDGITVWGIPAELSGTKEKILRWVSVHQGQGVYITFRSEIEEKELFRVAEGMSFK